jgi:hypothetical protein
MRVVTWWRPAAVTWWRPAAVAGLMMAFILTVACSGPRSGASATGGVSGCAAVLPLAHDIVHDEGTLTMVRRISRTDADALSRKLGAEPPPVQTNPHRPGRRPGWPKSCLVVYHGNYPAGMIAEASSPALSGHYVLMVLRVRHPSIDRVLVTDQLPPGVHS